MSERLCDCLWPYYRGLTVAHTTKLLEEADSTHTHTHSSFSLWSATVEREEEEEEEEEEEWMEEGMDQREREES